jgi:diadenosine tetraphosphate (Ap4A) HIT family hydrolase
MDEACPFCRKLAALDELPPGEIVWPFPHSVAFLGSWQFYEGYCVLVSRRHATELSQLPDNERVLFLDEMCLLAQAIELAYHPHKLNYELLGNQVPHLHWHLFPRSKSDPNRLQPVWLELEAAERDPAVRLRMQGTANRLAAANTIREKLQALGADQA